MEQDLDKPMICSGATPPELARALDWSTACQDWWLAMCYAHCVIWHLPTELVDVIHPGH